MPIITTTPYFLLRFRNMPQAAILLSVAKAYDDVEYTHFRRWCGWGRPCEAGTQAKDTMMTIVQTARKLRVSTYNYLYDRISRANTMPSLSDLIRRRSTKAQPSEEKLAA